MPTVSELFDIRYGHSLELNRLVRAPAGRGIPFVSRRSGNNGIAAYVMQIDGLEPAPAGEMTCALSGNGVLSTFLQDQPYYTAFHVARLIAKIELSTKQKLFYAVCIKMNRYRYSYGRQANRSLKDIDLPSVDQIPLYVSQCNEDAFAGRDGALLHDVPPALNVSAWQPVQLQDLFDIKKGKRFTKMNRLPGSTPFISAIDNNNGLRQFVAGTPLHPAGVLTVNYNGNGVAEAFYQPHPFMASDDVNVLYPRFEGLTALSALFFCAVIRLEKYRFNYGRKWNLERMKESIIRLPMSSNGMPDIAFMEQYMATLPFSSNVEHAPSLIAMTASV